MNKKEDYFHNNMNILNNTFLRLKIRSGMTQYYTGIKWNDDKMVVLLPYKSCFHPLYMSGGNRGLRVGEITPTKLNLTETNLILPNLQVHT